MDTALRRSLLPLRSELLLNMEASDFYEAFLSTYKIRLLHTQEGSEKFTSHDFNIISLTVL